MRRGQDYNFIDKGLRHIAHNVSIRGSYLEEPLSEEELSVHLIPVFILSVLNILTLCLKSHK